MKQNEIWICDPYVVLLGDTYYMYGSDGTNTFSGKPAVGFPLHTSKDMIDWEGPFYVFKASEDFWGKTDFWAPEMHQYKEATISLPALSLLEKTGEPRS